MTDANGQKPEAGEVSKAIEFIRDCGAAGKHLVQLACVFVGQDCQPTRADVRDLVAAGFVPAASLAAAEARVVELEAQYESAQTQWREVGREQQEKRMALAEQLASERAGREHLEQAAELLRRHRHFEQVRESDQVIDAGKRWMDDYRVWQDADQTSTPTPPSKGRISPDYQLPCTKCGGADHNARGCESEGPASPVAEGDRVQVEALRMTLDAVTETLKQRNEQLRARAAEREALLCVEMLANRLTGYRLSYPSTDAHEAGRALEKQLERVAALRSQPTPTGEAKDRPACSRNCEGGKSADPRDHAVNCPNSEPVAPAAEGEQPCDNCGFAGPCELHKSVYEPPPVSPPANGAGGEKPRALTVAKNPTPADDGFERWMGAAETRFRQQKSDQPTLGSPDHVYQLEAVLEHLLKATRRLAPPSGQGPTEALGPKSLSEVPVFISEAIKVDLEIFTARLVAALRLPGAHGAAEYALNRVADELAKSVRGGPAQ